MGCPTCGTGTMAARRFGPNLVLSCSHCHALRVEPLADARVPSLQEHADILRDEIRAAQAEARDAADTTVRVDRAGPHRQGALVEAQVVSGRAKGLGRQARLEAWPADAPDDEASCNGEVQRRSASHIHIIFDHAAWAHLRAGTLLRLRPREDATVMRNLLKAYLWACRRHDGIGDLVDPAGLPRLDHAAVPGVEPGTLRPSQQKALWAALRLPERGVLMVHGPPGTGKTTVIARIVEEAVRRRHTVLVASHTHVAIDNALQKALRQAPGLERQMVRLGDTRAVAPGLAHVNRRISHYHMDPEEPGSLGLFANLQAQHGVVGMTLDALACAVLAAEALDQDMPPFDYVIVDEAGMNAFPKSAIAHSVARRLVLVGDPMQLPPILRAWSADDTHRRSHFETLQRQRPDLAVLLDEQFRCAPGIYSWSQHAMYGGRVVSRTTEPGHGWRVAGVPVAGSVVWVDTARVPRNRDRQVSGSRANEMQAHIAAQVLLDLARQGMASRDMGYITPFRAQADEFMQVVQERPYARIRDMAASTVDAFQGSERRCILYDFTTLRPAKPHEDARRLNVSLTRAQELLLLLGPRDFVRDAAQNPYHASLQRWGAPEVVAAPHPELPAPAR